MQLLELLQELRGGLRIGFGASWFGGEYDETQIVLASSDFFLGDEPDNEPDPTLIRKQLDSGSDREKLDAMKRIIAVRFLDIFFSSTDTFISSFPKVMMSPNIFIRLPGTSTPKISRYGNWSIFTFLKYAEDLSDGSSQEGSTGGASSEEEDVDKS